MHMHASKIVERALPAEAAADAIEAALTAAPLAARAEEFAMMTGGACNRLRFASVVPTSAQAGSVSS